MSMSELRRGPGRREQDVLLALLLQAGDWIWETDEAFRFTSWQAGAEQAPAAATDPAWLGRCDWEIPGELLYPATWSEHRERLQAHLPFSRLMVRRTVAGAEPVLLHLCGVPRTGPRGRFLGYQGLAWDVSHRHAVGDVLRLLEGIDPLTRLLNRGAFDERAEHLLGQAYAVGQPCALVEIGPAGERLSDEPDARRLRDRDLAAAALALAQTAGPGDLLARRDGDRLLVLLAEVGDLGGARRRAQRLLSALPDLDGARPCAGLALFPRDATTLDGLCEAATAALMTARDEGPAALAERSAASARRAGLRARLAQCLAGDGADRALRLVYQPLVSLCDGRMLGAEALLRWRDPELGEISPGEFVPIAEESGLISRLGDWVLREACRQRSLWRQAGLAPPPIAINLSSAQLRDAGLCARVLGILAESGVAPGEIEIEITETGLLADPREARKALEGLRAAGVRSSLDDFGTGYSSLSHLRDLPIHRLKIDRSFTLACLEDPRSRAIIEAVIDLAHRLGLSVTAEGVENADQLEAMRLLGCDAAQGFHLARPLAAGDFLRHTLEPPARHVPLVAAQTEPPLA
jgi:EAL domain-containing protein (putative c-di-GMP-specific phosphodiesterase class I)/GGDEF domain-containing protein